MLPLAQMTPEQQESYRPIWGEFTRFNYTFMNPQRIFGFSGALDVAEQGKIAVADLLVACSYERAADELGHSMDPLQERSRGAGWQHVSNGSSRREVAGETYQLAGPG